MDLNEISITMSVYDDLNKQIISLGNRLGARKAGGSWEYGIRFTLCGKGHKIPLRGEERKECPICKGPVKIIEEKPAVELVNIHQALLEHREKVASLLQGKVTEYPEWRYLSLVKGMGPINTARLLLLYPPKFNFEVSKAIAYAGLALVHYCQQCGYKAYGNKKKWNMDYLIENGVKKCPKCGSPLKSRMPKLADMREDEDGFRITYKAYLKTSLLKVLSDSLIRAGGVYYLVYLDKKEEELGKHPDWKKMRIDMTARASMVRLLLTQYYAFSAVVHGKANNFVRGLRVVLGDSLFDHLTQTNHDHFYPFPLVDYVVDKKTKRFKDEYQKLLDMMGVDSEGVMRQLVKTMKLKIDDAGGPSEQ